MSWFSILKMPRVYRGPDIRNEAQYNAASLEGRRKWHNSQAAGYDARLQALRTQQTVDLTDVENPVYKEMKEYQEMRNFHNRQGYRLKRCIALGKTECNDYYSLELEGDNRKKQKLMTTPTGKQDTYVELSLEAYNNLTDKQKYKYHVGIKNYGKDVAFHSRMAHRIRNYKSGARSPKNLPTFPSPKHGGGSFFGKEYTKEEYLSMDKQDKKNYHSRMTARFRVEGNIELRKFHEKMYSRLKRNSLSPTYYSPEHEQEES